MAVVVLMAVVSVLLAVLALWGGAVLAMIFSLGFGRIKKASKN